MQDAKSSEPQILIDLSTAIIGTDSGTFQCRLVEDDTDTNPGRLPFGPFVPDQHRTMEIGLRQWVGEQVGVELGHVEQLYTFADRGRQHATPGAPHVVSVGYLALTNQAGSQTQSWRDIYSFFPWEDWRDGEPSMLAEIIYPALDNWLTQHAERRESARLAFGRDGLALGGLGGRPGACEAARERPGPARGGALLTAALEKAIPLAAKDVTRCAGGRRVVLHLRVWRRCCGAQ